MNGLMQRYKESLERTPGPVRIEDLPPMVIDYRGLIEYAKKKGVHPVELSESEKKDFISPKDSLNQRT